MVPQQGDASGVVRKTHTFGESIAQESALLQDHSIHSFVLPSFH